MNWEQIYLYVLRLIMNSCQKWCYHQIIKIHFRLWYYTKIANLRRVMKLMVCMQPVCPVFCSSWENFCLTDTISASWRDTLAALITWSWWWICSETSPATFNLRPSMSLKYVINNKVSSALLRLCQWMHGYLTTIL